MWGRRETHRTEESAMANQTCLFKTCGNISFTTLLHPDLEGYLN